MAYTAVWWRIPGEVLTEQYISMVRVLQLDKHNNTTTKRAHQTNGNHK